MKKLSAALLVLVSLLAVGCCGPQMVAATSSPTRLSAEEMLTLLKRTFPHLENGKTLFVTTGEYWAYPVTSYEQVFRTIQTQIPSCRYKATVVVLGELHQSLDKLVAAGIAMGQPGVSPAWFVVLVDITRTLYGLDPATGNRWQLRPNDVALLII